MLGIDFGTMNIRMAYKKDGVTKYICNENKSFVPAAITFTKAGEIAIGTAAARQCITNKNGTILSIINFLEKNQTIKINNIEYSQINIVKLFFSKLIEEAEQNTKEIFNDLLIALPTYVSPETKDVIKQGIQSAGLNIIGFRDSFDTIWDYQYVTDEKINKAIIVDVGGYSMDAIILEKQTSYNKCLGIIHNEKLGSNEIDTVLMNYIIKEFKRKEAIDLSCDTMALQRIKEASELCKIRLSAQTETNINLPFITATNNGPKHLGIIISRELLNQLMADYLSNLKKILCDLIGQFCISVDDIDEVLLVGGGAYINSVQQLVKDIFGEKYKNNILNPDELSIKGLGLELNAIAESVSDVQFNKESENDITGKNMSGASANQSDSFKERIERLVYLKEIGLISETEFEQKRTEIINLI